ncbi:MAG: ABC transporter permease subunit, partial [Planctomycetaceae bacterium]|nr:ABC transporter permease subunit [Planctomycetaceae bacterium]
TTLPSQFTPPSFDAVERTVPAKVNDQDTTLHLDWSYVFGSDSLGRDLALMLWSGSTVSLLVGFFAVGISVIIGVLVGGVTGFFGRGKARLPFLLTVTMPPMALLVSTFDFLGDSAEPLAVALASLGGLCLVLQFISAAARKAWRTLVFFVFASLLAAWAFGYNRIQERSGILGQAVVTNNIAQDTLQTYVDQLDNAADATREFEAVRGRHDAYTQEKPDASVENDAEFATLKRKLDEAHEHAKREQLAAIQLRAEYDWRLALARHSQLLAAREANRVLYERQQRLLLNESFESHSKRQEQRDTVTGLSSESKVLDSKLGQVEAEVTTSAARDSEAIAKSMLSDVDFRSSQALMLENAKIRANQGIHNTIIKANIESLSESDVFYKINRNIPFLIIVVFIFIIAFLLLVKAAQEQGVSHPLLRHVYKPVMTIDNFVMRTIEILSTIPRLILLLTILAFYERSIWLVMFIIGVTSWMGTARFVRAEVLSLRERDFVQAARSLGVTDFGVILRHLVPNSLSPVLISATLGVADAILLESTLSFLNLGAAPDEVTWGKMLSEGRQYITTAPWLTIVPGIAILVVTLSFNLLGEGMREALNPKLRKR